MRRQAKVVVREEEKEAGRRGRRRRRRRRKLNRREIRAPKRNVMFMINLTIRKIEENSKCQIEDMEG